MTADQAIALVASLITIVSFCGNMIQYKNRQSLIQRLRSFAQEEFMHHYMIARACTRLRHSDENEAVDKKLARHEKELFYINGFVDAARNNIIAVSKYQLEFTPEFIHPGYPEKVELDDKIRMGTRPSLRLQEMVTEADRAIKDQV